MRYPITDEETFIDIFGDALTVNHVNGHFFFHIYQGEDQYADAAFTRSQMHKIHARIGRLLGLTFTESGKRLDLPGEETSDD